ncbi:putative dTDP-glucose 4,6-dehydratase protein [Lentisphaera araneosa HTCC2155]|uniref:UDP-glucuronate decarboxylase n=1 Tax=Lentisphaera araneosa HTCC2155 TaxID=313628 RepID=A6DQH6_9BACT|nr:UDP-glucuronic acid decarboxylase family protein [Lentisphaera araneosa]EDM26057.1 putative dTDP-glucose 4,6-dehydratase protein [Lentisphaera araneosa HTCC2155]
MRNKYMKAKTILVTGGAGFLGSHLCDRLINEGHNVICLDNLQTGYKQNVAHLLSHSSFEFIRHDICETIRLEVDEIYNLACPASPPHYQNNPVGTTKTCVLGSINMLGLAKRNNAKILQASTSEVYGDPKVHPQVEEYRGDVNPIGIRACYDEGKRCAETLFFDYHRQHGVKIKVMRIFNTYGPKMDPDDGRVVSNFIVQALQGKDITIYGDGSQTRSFCFKDDLLDGMQALMNSDDAITGPINIGNPDEFTIKELAEEVIRQVDTTSQIIYKPLPADDPTRRKPNIEKAKEILNWQPSIKLSEGLKPTIAYFDSLLRGEIKL